jgi:energy-coupling factor transporter ATP-binding protein EcfA2
MTTQTQHLTETHFETLDELMADTPHRNGYAQHIVDTIHHTPWLKEQFKGRSEIDVLTYVENNASRWVQRHSDDPLTLDLFLHETDSEPNWQLDNVFEEQSRIVLTGPVGSGKSTLLTQIAIQLASGIHPFTLKPIEPLKVLIVDAENTKHELGLRLRNLSEIAGPQLQRDHLHIECNDSHPLDLTDTTTADWLIEKTRTLGIEVLVIGPLYKLGGDGNPSDEHTALKLATTFDRLRQHTSLIIEAHTTKDGKSRLPYGAAVWQRWPEYGLHLDRKGNLTPFRPGRGRGEWPSQLTREGDWPFTVATADTKAEHDHTEAILQFLTDRPGERFAKSRIATEMRTLGVRKRDSAIVAALERLAADGHIEAIAEGRVTYFAIRTEPAGGGE